MENSDFKGATPTISKDEVFELYKTSESEVTELTIYYGQHGPYGILREWDFDSMRGVILNNASLRNLRDALNSIKDL